MADDNASDPADFADGVLKSLESAVAEAHGGEVDAARNKARSALDNLVKAVVGGVPDDAIDDPCKPAGQDKNPSIASACLTRQLALKQNTRNEDRTTAAARSTLLAARDAWEAARDDYEHNIDSAVETMRAALSAAVSTHKGKYNPDSRSRNQVLYFSMMSTAATALQTYQGTAQSEGATLATAAGTLLTAYVAYLMAVEAAHAQRLADDSTTNNTFWTTIEGVFDAP